MILTSSYLAAGEKQSDRLIKTFSNSVTSESLGNYGEAINEMQLALIDNRDDYLINLRLGWLYYLNKDYPNSIIYYSSAIKISDSAIEALLGITYPYAAEENWDKVVEIYEDIIDKDNLNYTANLNLGQYYLNQSDYITAKRLLGKLHDNYPSDYSVNYYLGWVYYNLGDHTTSNNHFLIALIASPGDTYALEGIKLTK